MTGQGKDKYDVNANYTTYVRNQHRLEMANPDISGATVLDFDDYTAQNSASRLGADASDLSTEVSNIHAAPSGVFGLSSLGQQVQQEADLAHGKLKGAVDLLASAMDSYSSAVTAAKKTFIDTDSGVRTSMTAIQQKFNAADADVTTPTGAAPDMKDKPSADPNTATPAQATPDHSAGSTTPVPAPASGTQPAFPPFTPLTSSPTFTLPGLLQPPTDGGE